MSPAQRRLLMLMTSFVHGGAERHTITLANHLGKSVPIVKGGEATRMEEGEFYAIETFGRCALLCSKAYRVNVTLSTSA